MSTDINTLKDAGINKYFSRNNFPTSTEPRYSSARNISGGRLGEGTNMELGGPNIKIKGKDIQMVINDGVNNRMIIGRREDGTYGIFLSKNGVEISGASGSNLLFATNQIYTELIFSTFKSIANEESADSKVAGFISYADTVAVGHNEVAELVFYKPSNLTITSADLQSVFADSFDPITHNNVRLDTISIFLNPTKGSPVAASGGTGLKFYRYTGGTTIRSGYNPAADEEKISDTFDASDISAIATGWNNIIVQQQTNDSSYLKYGTCAMNLVLTGYVTF